MISLVYALNLAKTDGSLIQLSTNIIEKDGRLCGVGTDHGKYYCKYTNDGGATWSGYQLKNGFEGIFITVRGSRACVVGREHDIRCTHNIDGVLNEDGESYDVDFAKMEGGSILQVQMDDDFMCLVTDDSETFCSPFSTENVEWIKIEPAGDGAKSVAIDANLLCVSKEDGIYCGAMGKSVDPNMELSKKYDFQLDQMSMNGNFLCGVTPDLNKHFLRCVDMSVTDKKMESWEGSQDWASVSVTNGFIYAATTGDTPVVYGSSKVITILAY
eukprot:NODE_335_length_9311_cov_0.760313.p6 type:complete len:271 gc:universal NODE_335_length_9311_cov_0.760313:6243-5431(-)